MPPTNEGEHAKARVVDSMMTELCNSCTYSPVLVLSAIKRVATEGLGGAVISWMLENKRLSNIDSVSITPSQASFVEKYDRSTPLIEGWTSLPVFMWAATSFPVFEAVAQMQNGGKFAFHDITITESVRNAGERTIKCKKTAHLPQVLVAALHLRSCSGKEAAREPLPRGVLFRELNESALGPVSLPVVNNFLANPSRETSTAPRARITPDLALLADRAPPCIREHLQLIRDKKVVRKHMRRLRVANAWIAANLDPDVLKHALKNDSASSDDKTRNREIEGVVKNEHPKVIFTPCSVVGQDCPYVGEIEEIRVSQCASACRVPVPTERAHRWNVANALRAVAEALGGAKSVEIVMEAEEGSDEGGDEKKTRHV